MFEGEKYSDDTKESFNIVFISISYQQVVDLKGFVREDLYYIEQKIKERYPNAKFNWKHPINEFLSSTT